MKKIALLLTALVMCVAAQAQVRTSRTFVKQKANMEWIIRAGLNINHLAGFEGGEGVKIGSRPVSTLTSVSTATSTTPTSTGAWNSVSTHAAALLALMK
jgi:hypothetical protein